MGRLYEYLRLILFAISLLIGIQVPGFVDQYGKSLQSHLLESQRSIGDFQDDADKYFDGDIRQLIEHYVKAADPVIMSGGKNIDALFSRQEELQQAFNDFQSSFYSPYLQVAVKPVKDIRQQVWERYTHTIVLTQEAVIVGVLSGVLMLLVVGIAAVFLTVIYRLFSLSRKVKKSQILR